MPKVGWHRLATAQKAAVLPQFPFTEQQFPNVLLVQEAFEADAEPHFPSILIGEHVPKPDWHALSIAQNAAVLPQLPFTEQQLPNVLPIQDAFVVDAEPHLPSILIGVHFPNKG